MWEWTWPLPEDEKECLEETLDNDLKEESMFSIPNGDVSHMSQLDDASPDASPQNSPLKIKRVHFAPGTNHQLGGAENGDGTDAEKKRRVWFINCFLFWGHRVSLLNNNNNNNKDL